MKILIFNWRDIKNPLSGGAEILTHEMAKRWVKWGHRVTQFSASFPDGVKQETIDGVQIIRRGAPDILSFSIPVHFWAFWYYWTKFRGRFDLVIDEIHGIPFFTPLFVKERKVALICEVANEIWGQMFAFPWSMIGLLTEKFYFYVYKKTNFLTISLSTQKDLISAGIPKEKITILPMGVTLYPLKKRPAKEKQPTLIFVGRLCRMKGIAEAISAFKLITKTFPKARFWIIGSGDKAYIKYLENLVKRKKLVNQVKFFGFVSEKEKFAYLARAHLLLHPSKREGWGLVVHEANSVGTPVVAYDSPGLRDIVRNGVNGRLCMNCSPEKMAKIAIDLLKNLSLYRQLQRDGLVEVKKASWNKTAKVALATLERV